jgi:thiamine-phosphate pyrophosphorylase
LNNIDFTLYLIADTENIQENLIPSVRKAIDGGVTAVQLRGKNLSAREFLRIGEKLRRLTDERSVKLFVNDRIDVAMILDADGIHLGQASLPVTLVRKISGGRFMIGVSTHNLTEAREAEAGGADFITFGPVFETPGKLAFGPPVGLRKLANATREIKIPVFAIGGITIKDVKRVVENGGRGVAVISAILGSESVHAAAAGMVEELRLRGSGI